MTDQPSNSTPYSDQLRMVAALLGINADRLLQILKAPFSRKHLEYQLRAAWLINRHSSRFERRVVVAARKTLERAGHSTKANATEPNFTDPEEVDPGQQLVSRLEELLGEAPRNNQN